MPNSYGGVPQVDFSILGDLPKVYREAKQAAAGDDFNNTLSEQLRNGQIDYKQAAAMAARAGKTDVAFALLKQEQDAASDRSYSGTLAALGFPPTNPQAAPPPGTLPGNVPPGSMMPAPTNGAGPVPNAANGPPVPSTNRMVGSQEGVDLGLYDPRPGDRVNVPMPRPRPPTTLAELGNTPTAGFFDPSPSPAASPQPDPNGVPRLADLANGPQYGNAAPPPVIHQPPPSVAPATAPNPPPAAPNPAGPDYRSMPPGQGAPGPQHIPVLLGALSQRNIPEGRKEVLKTYLGAAIKNSSPTDMQRNYELAQKQGYTGSFLDYEMTLKRAGATAITNDMRGENAFESEFGKDQAKRWSGYITAADQASRQMVDLTNMREISRRVGSQGAWAGVKEAIGPYAEALGINVDNLSDIQAFSSTIMRLAPQQRVPGSGSTSDIEYKGMLKAIGGLANNPAAREAILDTFEAQARRTIAEGEIASRLATKEIDRRTAEVELRKLPDPMQAFRTWKAANGREYALARRDAAADPTSDPSASPQGQGPQPPAMQPRPATAAPPRNTPVIPPQAMDSLRSNPALRGQFDAKYGPGASDSVLGGQ